MTLEDKIRKEFDEYLEYPDNDLTPTLQHRIEVVFYSLVLSEFGCFTDDNLVTYCTTTSKDALTPAIEYWRVQGLFDDPTCKGAKSRGLTQQTREVVNKVLAEYDYQLLPSSAKDRYIIGTSITRLDFIHYINAIKPLPQGMDLSQIGAMILRSANENIGFSRVNLEQPELLSSLSIHQITQDGADAFWLATFINEGTISNEKLTELSNFLYRQLLRHKNLNILLWYTSVDDKKHSLDVFNEVPQLYGMPDGTVIRFSNMLRAKKDKIKKPLVHMFDPAIQTSYNYSVSHIFKRLTE